MVVHAANEGGRPRDRLGFADFRNIDGVCGFDFGFGGHKSLRLTSTSGWEAGVRTDLGHGPSAVLYPESPANQTFVFHWRDSMELPSTLSAASPTPAPIEVLVFSALATFVVHHHFIVLLSPSFSSQPVHLFHPV